MCLECLAALVQTARITFQYKLKLWMDAGTHLKCRNAAKYPMMSINVVGLRC